MDGLLTSLNAYHSLLVEHVEPPSMVTDDPHATLWLKTTGLRLSCKVFSGLEMFALLAHADWEVWKQQTKEIWAGHTLADFDHQPARINVDLVLYREYRVEPVFEMLATSAQDHAQPTEVVKAREVVHQILQDRDQVLAEVPVCVTRPDSGAVNGFIFKVMQIVASSDLLDRYHGLRLRFFRPNIASIALSAPELQQLAAMAAAGVAIDNVGAIKPEVHAHHPELFTKRLWTLFEIGVTHATAHGQGVKTVSLTKSCRADVLPGIYSAIGASSSVHEVTIDPAIDHKTPKKYCQEVWQWIGFTLFRGAPNNTHKLQAVTLGVRNLAVSDVDMIRAVISANDPIAKLTPRAASLATEAISSSRFVVSDPTKKNGVGRATVESPHVLTDLPVLKKSKEWTTVLVPPWGQAWVHRDDNVAKQNRA